MQRRVICIIISLVSFGLFAHVAEIKADMNTYQEEGSYTVTIPAEVSIDKTSGSGTLPVAGTLHEGRNLEIQIASANNYYLVNHENSEQKIQYKLSEDNIIISKNTDSSNDKFNYDVDISLQGKPNAVGEYTDTLTFEMTVESQDSETTSHKLTFDTNASGEDTIISTNEKFVAEGDFYGILPTPRRKGYTFEGWYTKADGGEKVDEKTTMGKEDTVIYAHWNTNVLTINYHFAEENQESLKGQKAKNRVAKTEKIDYNKKYIDEGYALWAADTIEKRGYTFDHTWKVGSSDSDILVKDSKVLDSKKFTGRDVAKLIGEEILKQLEAKNVTVELYPVFHANTYTVQYIDCSGDNTVTESVESSTHAYDTTFSLAKNKFVRKGYTFEGWGRKDGTEETTYAEGQGVKNLAESGNVTLYAKWRKNDEPSEKVEQKENNTEKSTEEEVQKSEKEEVTREENTSESQEQTVTVDTQNEADE